MHLKPLATAITILLAASGAMAAAPVVYNSARFLDLGGGLVELEGFARGVISNQIGTLSLELPDAARVNFFDTWNIDLSGISAGTYSFQDMVVDAVGSTLFDSVTFNSIDEAGVRQTVLFDLNAAGTMAVGSGNFTVRNSCPIASCVWIDVAGTEELGSGGYGGTTIAAVVPEPASYALLGLGLLAVGWRARGQRRA